MYDQDIGQNKKSRTREPEPRTEPQNMPQKKKDQGQEKNRKTQ